MVIVSLSQDIIAWPRPPGNDSISEDVVDWLRSNLEAARIFWVKATVVWWHLGEMGKRSGNQAEEANIDLCFNRIDEGDCRK